MSSDPKAPGARLKRERYLNLLFDVLFLPGFRDWQEQPGRVAEVSDLRTYLDWARRAEEATFDGIFFADFVGLRRSQLGTGPVRPFEPFTQAVGVSTATSHLGLVVTASTQFSHPYDLTRRLSALDNAAPGRVGWNVVTSFSGESNFGIEHIAAPEHRYEQADEFIHIVEQLWTSWPESEIARQRHGRPHAERYFDASSIRDIRHEGEHFRVDGALDIPPASAERPIIFQAGASVPGIRFAGRHAEAIFVALPNLGEAEAYDSRLREALAAAGRTRDQVRVIPGLSLILADSDEEARELQHRPRSDAQLLSLWDGIVEEVPALQGRGYGLDEVLPPDWFPSAEQLANLQRRRSRGELYRKLSLDTGQTLRQFLQRVVTGGAHAQFAGTPQSVADEIERWYRSGHIDGFVLISTTDIERLLGELVPLLKQRGIVKPEYLGPTFRENLGLA